MVGRAESIGTERQHLPLESHGVFVLGASCACDRPAVVLPSSAQGEPLAECVVGVLVFHVLLNADGDPSSLPSMRSKCLPRQCFEGLDGSFAPYPRRKHRAHKRRQRKSRR